ncbi:SH3-containing GRB2-like protein 3-interacting protein 1 Endophilin-3-interacting protein [Channa argus]|uniref:SH3-containing GRB2-like protein 3-interacting protein 1 Endophilin-3-interacting protein n=1 Tax=Channa argus TaxID=215402 RepID=A0A6G1PKL8_CHAAH|nr:SH3-containing GRB2-like protein 3-interacting protein 1 Endophilin-3-interacting protein [Channa argus]
MAEELCTGWFRIIAGTADSMADIMKEITVNNSPLTQGLKKRTRKAFGIRKKEKDNDSTGSPERDGGRKTNGAPNGFYGDIDWERYTSPVVDDEGYSIRPDEESEEGDILGTA